MRIQEVRLRTPDLHRQRTFYATTLGLPIVRTTEASLTLAIGSTRVVFEADSLSEPAYHIAFNIPENQAAEAREWLIARTQLITQNDRDFFDFQGWNAHATYFSDADGNILECIARHSLFNASSDSFGPNGFVSVSEVGLPVDSVPDRAAELQRVLGLLPFKDQSNDFAPLGDEEGLLIVVRAGRPWFPTAVPSTLSPLTLAASGDRNTSYRANGLPYVIRLNMEGQSATH